MINQDEKTKLIVSLLGIFERARAGAERLAFLPNFEEPKESFLSEKEQEELLEYKKTLPIMPFQPITPQACALLLSTEQIVGGVALNPVTYTNLKAEDAVEIAHQALLSLPCLNAQYKIVAVAMTTSVAQAKSREILDLFEQSLSELPNLQAQEIILVDPSTNNTTYSVPFLEHRIA